MIRITVRSSIAKIKLKSPKMSSIFLAVLFILIVVISSWSDNAKSFPQSQVFTSVHGMHICCKHKIKFGNIADLSHNSRISFLQTSAENRTNTSIVTVAVTLFGIDDSTGNVITFVTVKNLTKAVVSNATALDLKDGKTDGTAVVSLRFPSKYIKYGSEIKACNLTLNDLSIVCAKTQKSHVTRTVFMQLFLNYNK
jgi:hypothetical protein